MNSYKNVDTQEDNKKMIRRFAVLLALIAAPMLVFSTSCSGQDEKKAATPAKTPEKAGEKVADTAAEAAEKEVEDQLVRLDTLEASFAKAVNERNRLGRIVVQADRQLKEATDEEAKKKLKATLDAATQRYQTLRIALDTVFGLGRRREYEYNNVNSTVYLKVGTVQESFTRASQLRDALLVERQKLTTALEAEKDEAKKAEIQKAIDVRTKQYQLVAASLQVIFNVVPTRNYVYNPKDSRLYLKVTETEAEKIRADLAARQAAAEKARADAAGNTDADN